ncbi:cGMP-specific 3',5'-cyclic phosphodiesterase-like isoform X3 [Littorina saxatilis]|uniref:cGMP-specific 3',5'-cyclic phosphodiesterase-like isoform X3 n=1 Tax=Littorina saxatilis TaxID=31220 RepID=UPI0038B5C2B8
MTAERTRRMSLSSQITEEQVSNYLKRNTDFLLRWLSDNTTKEIVELFAKKLKDKNWDDDPVSAIRGKKLVRTTSPSSLTASFPSTARNSITSNIFRRYLDGDRTRKPAPRKDRKSLQRMSEEELFMELIRDIASELDVNLLCHKILQNVSYLTNSDRGSLFLVRGSRDNKHLVSKLFDVTETSTLEDVIHTERNEIKVPFGKGIVGLVAQSGKPINIKDAYEDPRFNQEIDRQTGYRTHSILSMPIVNYEGEVIGVAQIINKISGNHEFTQQDEDLFRKYLIFCGIGLTNAQLFEMSVNEFKRNQLLLHLARGIFQEQTNLEKLVQKIMLDAQDLLKCEKCCVYLLEDTCERDVWTAILLSAHEEKCEDAATYNQSETEPRRISPAPVNIKPKAPEEVVFSKCFDLGARDGTVTVPSASVLASSNTAFIAKFVVTTGEPVKVADLEADERFGTGPFVDTNGNPIKSVLCMPIHNSEKHIIGVTQLINKVSGEPFNDNDVNIIEAFSIFTGLGIHNCQMYENACQLMAKQSVALEVLSFHATAHTEEANALYQNSEIPSAEKLRLYTFDFDDMIMDDDHTLKACVRMFMEADIINTFKLPMEVACRWLCTVKKNYRPVTYHNWRHAFNVCQTMFTMLFTGELRPMFEDLEVFTLLAACLCHDLDHRGTNNAFQVKVASPLAMLYSTSVLEHHHFDHCIMILNSEGNNIFQSLSPDEYRRAIKLLEHAILSTDLALYFKKRGDFKKLVESGERTFSEAPKRDLLRAMMMTACDVAAITKPWKIQQEIAQLVTAEFFEQGDIERHQLGEQPIPMMDRNKKDELPKMQVGFIDAICAPVYKLFAVMTDKLDPLYKGCETNREKWQQMSAQKDKSSDEEEQKQQQQQPQKQPDKEEKPAKKEPEDVAVSSQGEPEQGSGSQQVGPPGADRDQDAHSHQDVAKDQGGPASHQDIATPHHGQDREQEGQPPVTAASPNTTTTTNATTTLPSATTSDTAQPQSTPMQPPPRHVNGESHSAPTLVTSPKDSEARLSRSASSPRNANNSSTPSTPPPSPSQPKEKKEEKPHVQSQAGVKDTAGVQPSKTHHQNGSNAVKQGGPKHGDGDPHNHITEHAQDPQQPRGKRKTHAQAHAQATNDKTTKKSGVCLVS